MKKKSQRISKKAIEKKKADAKALADMESFGTTSAIERRKSRDTIGPLFANLGIGVVVAGSTWLITQFFKLNLEQSFLWAAFSFVSSALFQLFVENRSLREEFAIQLAEFKSERVFEELQTNPTLLDTISKIAQLSMNAIQRSNSQGATGVDQIYVARVYNTLTECSAGLELLEQGKIKVKKSESLELWKGILAKLENSYQTTNFGQAHGSQKSKAVTNAQQEAIERLQGGLFERVFIHSEGTKIEESLISSQKHIGVKVGLLAEADYMSLSPDDYNSKIGCQDFAIVDQKYVYVTYTDNTIQKNEYVELTSEPYKVAQAKKLYSLIRAEATFPDEQISEGE